MTRNFPIIPSSVHAPSAVVSNMEERERKEDSLPESVSKISAPSSSSTTQITEGESGANRDSEEKDLAAKLDVSSDKFDPLLALYAPTVPLPYPDVKCFNNVAAYESFLKGGRGRAKPENVEKKRLKAMKGVADPERIERLKKLMVNNLPDAEGGEGSSGTATPRRRQPKPAKNVLTRMPLHTGSPLGQLHRCVEERRRVKVHIRTFKGLRGVCSGFIVAFDKFWNMAMVDVDETYRESLLGEALYHEKALTVTRLFEKLRVQESPEGGEGGRERTDEGKTQPNTRTTLRPQPKPPSTDSQDTRRGGVRRDPRPGSGPPESSEPRPPAKGPQKSESQPYGRVHTRHINQLFIRGENVLLVHLLPL